MIPFDCYKTYLALKNHFTKDNYDYHKYCGKSRASLNSFYKRKDRFWFEKVSRQKTNKEVEEFFVASFVSCDDPQSLWIGEIIKNGETQYKQWQRKVQSLSYIFKEEIEKVFEAKNFDKMFLISGKKHPLIFKEHLQGNISIESMLILNRILGYKPIFDIKLDDPVWKLTSTKLVKYSPFLNTDVFRYKKILKEIILGEQ
jgi:hypothetical protein